jgi:hypothetical protein
MTPTSNHHDNKTITIILYSSTVHQAYYEMTAMDKRSLIPKSVMVTRIDIHLAGEEPN